MSREPYSKSRKNRGLKVILLLIIVACAVIAWSNPIRQWLQQRQVQNEMANVSRDQYDFIALDFSMPPMGEDYSKADLKNATDYIDILAENGYHAISLDDVSNLLVKSEPVPANSVLITVDASSPADLLRYIDDAIRKHHWSAVCFISTEGLEERTQSAKWNDIQKLTASGRWEIGSKGHRGDIRLPATAAGDMKMHLIGPVWSEENNTHETIDAFKMRLVQDHETATTLINDRLKIEPIAYAYPLGDAGQLESATNRSAMLNRAAVESMYTLGFVSDSIGRNTVFSDAERLNRMKIDYTLSNAAFHNALRTAAHAVAYIEDSDLTMRAPGWIVERGSVVPHTKSIALQPATETSDAKAWLAGSDLLRDFHARIKTKEVRGDLTFLIRSNPEQNRYIWLTFHEDGSAIVSEQTMDTLPRKVLAEGKARLEATGSHEIEIFARSNNLDVMIDGIAVFAQPVRLDETVNSGRFGVSIANGNEEEASLVLAELKIQQPRARLATWPPSHKEDRYIIQWVHEHGGQLTDLSPPLAQVDDERAKLFDKLAGIYDLRLAPKVTIATDNDMKQWNPVALGRLIDDIDCDAIYVSFEHHRDLQVSDLDEWLQHANRMLNSEGKPLLVRLPGALERLAAVNALLAMVPAVELVTGTQSELPATAINTRQIEEKEIERPQAEEVAAIPALSEIPETAPTSVELMSTDMKIHSLSTAAETAYSRGAYEEAIAIFSEWHDLDPANTRPLRRIGDALVNLGYQDEAAEFYRQCLNMAPENTELAIRFARLLTDTGYEAEARSLLNIYARLFPSNPDILLAQAEWLYRQDRAPEAIARANRVLQFDPDNFEAILFRLRTAENDNDRNIAIEDLLRVSDTNESQEQLVEAIKRHDLLTYQSSYLLVGLMNQIYEQTDDENIQQMIEDLEPLTEVVTEDFESNGGFSDLWQVEGANITVRSNQVSLTAIPSRNEFSVRLLRSERWRDSFIETEISDVTGSFWLYARRSQDHLVRFGYDPAQQRLHLQIWKGQNNDVVTSRFIPWQVPEGSFKLRLNVRGKGVTGQVDGESVFDIPLELPIDFGFGRTALSFNTPQRGSARATVHHLSSGPLPLRIAETPAAPDQEADDVQSLQSRLASLTDLSPRWYSVDADGQWTSKVDDESSFFSIFARYYRLRLSPMVRVEVGATIAASDIITVCRTHDYDGLMLWFDEFPNEEWFTQMDRELNTPGLDVIAISAGGYGAPPMIRGIAGSRTLFSSKSGADALELLDINSPIEDEDDLDLLAPAVYIFE